MQTLSYSIALYIALLYQIQKCFFVLRSTGLYHIPMFISVLITIIQTFAQNKKYPISTHLTIHTTAIYAVTV